MYFYNIYILSIFSSIILLCRCKYCSDSLKQIIIILQIYFSHKWHVLFITMVILSSTYMDFWVINECINRNPQLVGKAAGQILRRIVWLVRGTVLNGLNYQLKSKTYSRAYLYFLLRANRPIKKNIATSLPIAEWSYYYSYFNFFC